jgi:hypothetical protein
MSAVQPADEEYPMLVGEDDKNPNPKFAAERRNKDQKKSCDRCCTGCKWCCFFIIYVLIELIIYGAFAGEAQCWMLENPSNPIANTFVYPVAIGQSLGIGRMGDMIALQEKWGNNLCAAGQVWLSSYDDVAKAVLNPQKRNARLGEHPLIPAHFPMTFRGGRDVFLLALGNGDLGEGKPGDHKAFRQAFVDTLLKGHGQDKRMKGEVAEGLWKQLEDDYKTSNLGDAKFYDSMDFGLYPFVCKLLHYVFLGIDPTKTDQTVWDTLNAFYFGEGPLSYYLSPVGYGFGSVAGNIDAIIKIYVDSPVMKEFKTRKDYHEMTTKELAGAATVILRMAGVQGTQAAIKSITGVWGNPPFPGSNYATFSKTDVWDKLDLDDTKQVDLYITEALRLTTAVTISNRVATEAFSAKIKGDVRHFPEGTNVGIPLALANTDPAEWGDDAHEFNMHRKGLMTKNVIWNGVGFKEGNGRWCPGRGTWMEVGRGIIVRLGKIRQKAQ